ncbi:MAG: FHA domain-containing protein [Oligoflexia bacterium]|nr:FHA domain-containing protein [Oligoflexia bacterium]
MKLVLEHFGIVIKESFLEEGREYFIGRQKDCDFVLEEDSGVSRKHVKIYQSAESGNWRVESTSEWGGLYLNGEEIQSIELENSCSLKLKNYSLKFIQEEESRAEEAEEKPQDFAPSSSLLKEESLSVDDKTKIEGGSHLLYSLHIFIDGEFSDHVSLSLGDSWVLGRSEECDICIDYSFLTRRHVQFLKKESKFYVKDLGSANKTLLNEKELSPNQETLLNPNDEVSVADLKIRFEVRNTQHEALMKNLPASLPNTEPAFGKRPAMVFPKVVLEESHLEETSNSPVPFFKDKKKKRILFALLPILAFALYFKYEEKKQKEEALALERNKLKIQQQKLEVFYKEALSNLELEKYQFCVEQLEELHRKSSTGYFRDSQQLLVQCESGRLYQKQKKAQEEAEKLRQETELEIKKLADQCQKEFDENKIKSREDLNLCAGELLSLDPNNPVIASIMNVIQERETLRQLEEQKRAEYRKFIRGKKALYNKAKKLRDQKKALKAVSAYNVFLKSARGVASLKSLYEKAEQERDATQKGYDDELNALYESCESLIESGKMKTAYSDCRKILKFKNYDKKAVSYVDKAKRTLQSEIKPLYEQSLWHESFSRVDEALKIWRQILEKDIKDGYYYKKADFQIKKYK